MASLLSVERVSKEFNVRGKKVLALDSLSLTVDEAEFLTVVGPSGCGKSTLLNLIVGLLQASSGRILFRNRPINGINPEIGYITQKDNLLPWRTLVENVEIALEIRGVEKSERKRQAEGLIARVGLNGFETHYPHELSGGMRQRANIIRTLIYDPERTLVRRMARALVRANKWALSSTPEQVVEALKPSLGKTEPAIFLAGVKSVLPTLSPDGRITERNVQITQDIMEQAGLLKKRVAYSDIVTNEFLPK